jgi:hypothetical protein
MSGLYLALGDSMSINEYAGGLDPARKIRCQLPPGLATWEITDVLMR